MFRPARQTGRLVKLAHKMSVRQSSIPDARLEFQKRNKQIIWNGREIKSLYAHLVSVFDYISFPERKPGTLDLLSPTKLTSWGRKLLYWTETMEVNEMRSRAVVTRPGHAMAWLVWLKPVTKSPWHPHRHDMEYLRDEQILGVGKTTLTHKIGSGVKEKFNKKLG